MSRRFIAIGYNRFMRGWSAWLLSACLIVVVSIPLAVSAEEAASLAARAEGRLPPPSVTRHDITLGDGETLHFEARAGAVMLAGDRGEARAEIGFVAYSRVAANDAPVDTQRPITFAVNGGPGAASAYLHIGVLGPWRLPMGNETISPSQNVALVENAETWLTFTDLVFVDPVGTGFSRLAENDQERRDEFLSVEGDIAALADFILDWLVLHERVGSPVYFIGESYGGFRGPLLAERLQNENGIALSGMTLLSPVLDFGWRDASAYAPLSQVSLLPSLAAAAREGDGAVLRSDLADVEAYAAGEFLTDLLRGLGDDEAVARLVENVTRFTGLDEAVVEGHQGRIDMQIFVREIERGRGRIASFYDARVTADHPAPEAAFARALDPVLDAMTPPLTRAMLGLYREKFAWMPQRRYILLNNGVNRAWSWGRGRGLPEAISALRRVLALDENLDVLVVHGLTDLVTPYFETALLLRQIRPFTGEDRVRLRTYGGGHMFYNRETSRRAFLDDAMRLYRVEGAAR
ncbi:MAG: S10 family peptidase [Salinarimonas sp.]